MGTHIDLRNAFRENTGRPLDIDLAVFSQNLDVEALAAAAPWNIAVSPYLGGREAYYAATLAALAFEHGTLSQTPHTDPSSFKSIQEAGANVAASFANFTREPVFQTTGQTFEEEDASLPPPAHESFFHMEYGGGRIVPSRPANVPEKTEAVFETMRNLIAARIGAALGRPASEARNTGWYEACDTALRAFRREGNLRCDAPAPELRRSEVAKAAAQVGAALQRRLGERVVSATAPVRGI